MSVSNVPSEHARANWKLPDPGDVGALPNTKSGSVALVSAAAETRTLARPSKVDLQLLLYLNTDGGDITITVTGGYDVGGSTSIVMGTVGGYVMLRAVEEGTTKRWQLMGYDGVTGPSLDFATLTVDTLNIDTILNIAADLEFTGATGVNQITLPTNLADALSILDSAGTFIEFRTTTGTPRISFTPATTFIGVITASTGIVCNSQAMTPNTDGGLGSTILAGVSSVTVGAVTTNADDWILLPALSAVPAGHTIKIACNAGTNFELRTPAGSDEKINAVNSDGDTKEYLCTDTELIYITSMGSTAGWIASARSAAGAVVAAVVPDA